jgi:hypothetical protein
MPRFTARATVGGECTTALRIEGKKEMRLGVYRSHGLKPLVAGPEKNNASDSLRGLGGLFELSLYLRPQPSNL